MEKVVNTDPEDPCTETETARMLGLSVYTLRNYRSQGKGLPYHKISRRVIYLRKDIKAFRDAGRVEPEA